MTYDATQQAGIAIGVVTIVGLIALAIGCYCFICHRPAYEPQQHRGKFDDETEDKMKSETGDPVSELVAIPHRTCKNEPFDRPAPALDHTDDDGEHAAGTKTVQLDDDHNNDTHNNINDALVDISDGLRERSLVAEF